MPQRGDLTVRVQKLRNMGMSRELICSRLLIEGWSDGAIQQCFPDPELPAPHTDAASVLSVRKSEPPKSGTWLSTFLIALIATVLVGAGTGAYYVWRPPVVYSISIPSDQLATTTLTTLSYGMLPALADPDYYGKVKEALALERATYIDANLSDMRLRVYGGGELKLDVAILAKGKVGSWWETPIGIYKIESREWNHFSSFGEVDMPYSMGFQGNFFIHGWPTYKDGTPVATSYSGGCIRLSTEDAGKVFGLVTVGTPVIVYNVAPPTDDFGYELKAPAVSASAYLVADVKNGAVLAGKNEIIAGPIASITKLMSALVITEYINLDKTLTVPQEAIVYTSVPRLKAGKEARAYDLLHLLLQESSNEAAETFAAEVGREAFVKHMNEKAHAIGLEHTVFSDPSGAKGDYSTPEDLFKLLRYVFENRRFIFSITTNSLKDTAYGNLAFKSVQNFNGIAGATLQGGKVGQTREAKETYAGIFSIPIGGQKRDIAIIVLGSQDSVSDVKKLHDFAAKNYQQNN